MTVVKEDTYYIRAAWICIVGFSLFRLWFSGQFLLAPDETNYWQWGRHMAWGYHDQAPMIAWMIRLSTLIFGNTETAVRLPSVIAMAITSTYLILIAKRWFGNKVAFSTAILSQSILEFNVGSLLATPDGIQAAAWAAASYHVARAFEDDAWSQWLIAGMWFGFGMLSKYTMVIFLPGVFLYGLFSDVHRKRLVSIRPYCGLVLGIFMFFPVIMWNAANNWNSVRHVAFLGGANASFTIHWRFLRDFLASQAGLLSPLIFILGLMAWVLAIKKRKTPEQWIYPYLFFASFPMVAAFACLSLHTRIYGNWPAAGYLTASVLMAAFFSWEPSHEDKTTAITLGKKMWPWTLFTSYLITALVLIQVLWPLLPLPTKIDRTSTELQGWWDLGQTVAILKKQMPRSDKTFLFGLRYQTASELAFYTPGQPQTVSINKWKRPNVYDYWINDEDIIGWDAIGVTDSPESDIERLNQVFDRVDSPQQLNVYRDRVWSKEDLNEKPVKTYYIYRAYGFKGGLRWDPPETQDIRVYKGSFQHFEPYREYLFISF